MLKWLKRIRPTVKLGLIWATVWAPIGILIGIIVGGNSSTPDGFPVDDWLMPLAILGFLGGVTFAETLRIAEGRRFADLSIPRSGMWGALGGLLLGAIAVVAWQFDAGYGPVLWPRAAALIGSSTLLSALSASGSLALAKSAKEPDTLDAGADDLTGVGLTDDEKRELLGGG